MQTQTLGQFHELRRNHPETTMPKQPALPAEDFQPTDAEREIADAAELYIDARDKRIPLTAEEVTQKQNLIGIMHKHNLTTCSVNGVSVQLIPGKEKVKVKRNGDAGGDDDGEGDDE